MPLTRYRRLTGSSRIIKKGNSDVLAGGRAMEGRSLLYSFSVQQKSSLLINSSGEL